MPRGARRAERRAAAIASIAMRGRGGQRNKRGWTCRRIPYGDRHPMQYKDLYLPSSPPLSLLLSSLSSSLSLSSSSYGGAGGRTSAAASDGKDEDDFNRGCGIDANNYDDRVPMRHAQDHILYARRVLFNASVMAVMMATGQEHKDGDGGGNTTMGWLPTARRGDASIVAGGGGGGNAACPTAGDEIKREGEQDCSNNGRMKKIGGGGGGGG